MSSVPMVWWQKSSLRPLSTLSIASKASENYTCQFSHSTNTCSCPRNCSIVWLRNAKIWKSSLYNSLLMSMMMQGKLWSVWSTRLLNKPALLLFKCDYAILAGCHRSSSQSSMLSASTLNSTSLRDWIWEATQSCGKNKIMWTSSWISYANNNT